MVPLHVTFWQVCTGQAPQLTCWPQVSVTVPHFPVQAFAAGVQQPLPVQTCPLVQHAPLQQICPPPVQAGPF